MQYDIILISGEEWCDHPFSGIGLLKRFLEREEFTVKVLINPKEITEKPRLFFGVSAGAMDSMLANYTPMKKLRENVRVPKRAVIFYSNMIKKRYKDVKIVIGGIESSLRRFGHYDYWDNKLRKSILLDSRADILVYGYGELQLLEIAKKLKEKKELEGIDGTCIVSKELPKDFTLLPSFEDIQDKEQFCKMQNMFDVNKNLAQEFDERYVLQYKTKKYSTKDLDYIYSLDFSRKITPGFKPVEFSVLTHRGCIGNCNFCSITLNSGNEVISRSVNSIIDEVKKITKTPNFKGTIELSGASANMYGMDCNLCDNDCLKCDKLDKSHKKILKLLRTVKKIDGVKKVNIKSGIRFDLAIHSDEYIKEIAKYHIEDTLMIAPEHIDKEILKLMNKEADVESFIKKFKKYSNKKLSFYIMVGHPGCTIKNSEKLNLFTNKYKNTNFVQVFTPTPMTVSTCMYHTGLNPKTLKPIYIPYTYNEKKRQKNIALKKEIKKKQKRNA